MLENSPEAAPPVETSGRTLTALVALLAADPDERADGTPVRRSEAVLADAGCSYQEIARLTGKKTEAVRSALRRARQTPAKESKT
jgi:DNA-directed RNA polymerase specialized sigma24 family protein